MSVLTCTSFVSDSDEAITADREHQNSSEFREFCRHLFHDSLRQILVSLKDGMQTPGVVLYADRHHCRTAYGLGLLSRTGSPGMYGVAGDSRALVSNMSNSI